ncbi:hypothetical protein, partial [Rhizobium phaseoli]|uniref:hypothetical protein n=1 Tax=Rhizobium phaseoli TaxID=396 RepID=UPI001AEED60F
VRQRMKLTGTNSSIGLIVLIDCAHLKANAKHSSCQGDRKAVVRMMLDLCPDAPMALRTARQTIGDGLWPVWVPQAPSGGKDRRRVQKKTG